MASVEQVEQAIAQDEEVVDIVIYQKSGEPYAGPDGKPCTWGVVGKESKRYTQAVDAVHRQAGRPGYKITPESTRNVRVSLALGGSVRWSGWTDNAGKALEFSAENARKFLKSADILQQVEDGIGAHAAFFAKLSAS